MKLSRWDRALMSIAPSYGVNRIRARMAAEALVRHYEAAMPGRRTQNWHKVSSDADMTIRAASQPLRWAARDLIRNNSWAKRGRNVVANNAVGWGIVAKPEGVEAALEKRVLALWDAWAGTTECESEGRHTFYGLQHLAMRSIYSDGEVLIRRRYRRAKDDLTLPIQLQILEADFIDSSKNLFESQAGGPIIAGIEFDKLGRRAAYWLWSQHPGSGRNIQASKRIPADDVLHIFDAERAGQSRGVSWLGSAIVDLNDLGDYDDAEVMKQKIAACFAAFVTDTDGLGTALGEQSKTDPLVETFEPGMIVQLPAGKTVTTANPPTLTSDALPMRTLRKVAAGIGITYEDLTGDYSQVNFSSARMARIAHWGNVHHWRENMIIPQLCNGVWAWAMEAAEIAGELPMQPTASWTAPPMPMIEPDKEGLALQRLVRTGAMTPSQMVREQGRDPDSHWLEYAADLKTLDANGIKLDCDVRVVSAAGLEQPSETATNSPPPPSAAKAAREFAEALAAFKRSQIPNDAT